jgi:hypothetical protein
MTPNLPEFNMQSPQSDLTPWTLTLIQWLILTLLLILNQSHKVWALQIAKVPLQISFKHSEISDQQLFT